MAKNDVYGNMNLTNMSYLLDPGAVQGQQGTGKEKDTLLPAGKLVSFKDHPFHVETDDGDFRQLVDSIRENGLIYPVVVRPKGDVYEIIAGHRRVAACREAGMEEIPSVIRELDDFEATVLMVHSNFYREKIKTSEKAKAYRMCMEAEKHQGRKGGDTALVIGKGEDSRRQVYRYIRLSYLSDPLLMMVDDGKMPVNTGVELAYLDEASQGAVLGFMDDFGMVPSPAQAADLRKLYEENKKPLSKEMVISLLGKALKKKPAGSISFKRKELQDYFAPDTDAEHMSGIILMLLEKYRDGELDGVLGD